MESSGWMFTDAVQMVDCPKCGQDVGFNCRTPGGRKTRTPHGERVVALQQLPSFNIEDYTGKSTTIDELIKRGIQ